MKSGMRLLLIHCQISELDGGIGSSVEDLVWGSHHSVETSMCIEDIDACRHIRRQPSRHSSRSTMWQNLCCSPFVTLSSHDKRSGLHRHSIGLRIDAEVHEFTRRHWTKLPTLGAIAIPLTLDPTDVPAVVQTNIEVPEENQFADPRRGNASSR